VLAEVGGISGGESWKAGDLRKTLVLYLLAQNLLAQNLSRTSYCTVDPPNDRPDGFFRRLPARWVTVNVNKLDDASCRG
jgi:hypothetical protein